MSQVEPITIRPSKELALQVCAICGRWCKASHTFCVACEKRWDIYRRPVSEWPDWLHWLDNHAQTQRRSERRMLDGTAFWTATFDSFVAPEEDNNNDTRLQEIADWLLDQCTKRQREAIELYLFHDYTLVETAEAMGVSHQSVHKTIARGIEKIQEAIW